MCGAPVVVGLLLWGLLVQISVVVSPRTQSSSCRQWQEDRTKSSQSTRENVQSRSWALRALAGHGAIVMSIYRLWFRRKCIVKEEISGPRIGVTRDRAKYRAVYFTKPSLDGSLSFPAPYPWALMWRKQTWSSDLGPARSSSASSHFCKGWCWRQGKSRQKSILSMQLGKGSRNNAALMILLVCRAHHLSFLPFANVTVHLVCQNSNNLTLFYTCHW